MKYRQKEGRMSEYCKYHQFISIIKQNSKGKMQTTQSSHGQNEAQRKYAVIDIERRAQLIRLVTEENVSIYKASRVTGINGATAKDIVRKYRKHGTVYIRKAELKRIEDGSAPQAHDEESGNAEITGRSQEQNNQEEHKQEQGQLGSAAEISENSSYFPLFPMMFYCWL